MSGPTPLEDRFAAFAPLFGREEARRHAFTYLQGLLRPDAPKSIEPIALRCGDGRVSGLQKFINAGPWKAGLVFNEVARQFAAEADRGSGPVVAVPTLYGFPKRGAASVGVDRQKHPGVRRTMNCQVGIFLVGFAGNACAMLNAQLYLPESWCVPTDEGAARRAKTQVPDWVHYRTRSQLTADLIYRTALPGYPDSVWVAPAPNFVGEKDLLSQMESLVCPYLVPVPAEEPVTVARDGLPHWSPAPHARVITARELAAQLPPRLWVRPRTEPSPWRAGGEEYATVPVRSARAGTNGRAMTLVVRRVVTPDEATFSYRLTNAPARATPELLAALVAAGAAAEAELDRDAEWFGLKQYETRSWPGWHHHMSLVAVAALAAGSGRRPAGEVPQ